MGLRPRSTPSVPLRQCWRGAPSTRLWLAREPRIWQGSSSTKTKPLATAYSKRHGCLRSETRNWLLRTLVRRSLEERIGRETAATHVWRVGDGHGERGIGAIEH